MANIGASTVDYNQGGAGAMVRTLDKRLRDFVSVKDFGAVGNGVADDTAAFQSAATYSSTNSVKVWVPDGNYKLSGTVDIKNASFDISDTAVLDFKDSPSNFCFIARGTKDPEIFISEPLTTGDKIILTETSHGLTVGDWILLYSQRACSHSDAGEWQLGSVTGKKEVPDVRDPVYFAEPLQVSNVTSNTKFDTTTSIIFPSYNIDDLGETAPNRTRTKSSIMKLNFATTSFKGGQIIAPDRAGLNQSPLVFDLHYLHSPEVSGSFDFDLSPGTAINAKYVYNGKFKTKVTRSPNWTLDLTNPTPDQTQIDHSKFNSMKDVSSWYCDWDYVEFQGSQCFDQSYADICSIYPRVRGKSYDSHQQGLTTHGNTYGIDINVFVTGNKWTGVSNRARFANINATVIGGDYNNELSRGLALHEFGQQDIKATVNISNTYRGIVFGKSFADVPESPEVVRADISGSIRDTFASAFYFDQRIENGIKPNQIYLHDLMLFNVNRAVSMSQGYWHGIEFDRVMAKENRQVEAGYFQFPGNSAFHKIKNINIDGLNADYLIHAPTFSDSSLAQAANNISIDVDWSTVILRNSNAYLQNGYNSTYFLTGAAQDVFDRRWFEKTIYVSLTNTALARTLTLGNSTEGLPVGSFIEFINRTAVTMLFASTAGVTIVGQTESGGAGSIIRIYRPSLSTYIIRSF